MEKTVITEVGRKKLCKAHAGDITLPKIARMAFGDGGVNEQGTELRPTGKETSLYNELTQKDIERHVCVDGEDGSTETTCQYYGRLDEGECTGKYISEIGLIDAEGDLIAIRTFLPMGKTEDIPLMFNMDEIF